MAGGRAKLAWARAAHRKLQAFCHGGYHGGIVHGGGQRARWSGGRAAGSALGFCRIRLGLGLPGAGLWEEERERSTDKIEAPASFSDQGCATGHCNSVWLR